MKTQVPYNGKSYYRYKSKPESSDSQYKAPTMCQGAVLISVGGVNISGTHLCLEKVQSACVGSSKERETYL